MTYESYSGEYPAPEHFSSPTPETRLVFNAAIEQLQKTFINRAAFVRHDYINNLTDGPDGHYVVMSCGIKESYRPIEDRVDSTADLSIEIATSGTPPVRCDSPNYAEELYGLFKTPPPKYRRFSHGKIHGDMTDTDYATAVTRLCETMPPAKWALIEQAHLLANTQCDAAFLPFAVTHLLDTATKLELPVCKSKRYSLEFLVSTNRAHFRVDWLDGASQVHKGQFGDYDTTCDVTITIPTGKTYIEYIYRAFADKTEQMLVETADKTARDELIRQGFAVPSDHRGWAVITAKERKMGIQAPNDTLMRQFSALIRDALESGAMPA